MRSAWQTPERRARLMRGLYLAANDDRRVQRARATMMANWQEDHFLAALRRRPRRFSAEQIQAIRADTRSLAAISAAYGINISTVKKIRGRITYRDV